MSLGEVAVKVIAITADADASRYCTLTTTAFLLVAAVLIPVPIVLWQHAPPGASDSAAAVVARVVPPAEPSKPLVSSAPLLTCSDE